MKLIERYIFRRMLTGMVLSFVALSAMLWLSQALRQFDLVTEQGQTLGTFLALSGYLFPLLIMIVLPLSVLIGVTLALSTLNSDSELAVMNASGMRQWTLVKPALFIGLIASVLIGSMSLYFTPLSLRLGQELLTVVRSSLVSSIAREGSFTQLADGLTFHLQSRENDGTLRGIFVSDDRDPMKSMTYIAQRGAIIDNPLGTFLVMANGSIQQRSKVDDTISIIEFTSYAFDLSTFTSGGKVQALTPQQRPTQYLLNPDPDDPTFRQAPGAFAAELNDRLTAPLWGMVFALVPLLFLGQAQSPRLGRSVSVALATISLIVLRAFAFFLVYAASGSPVLATGMYVLPIGTVAASILLVLRGVELRPPQSLLSFLDGVFGRIGGLFRRRAAATTGSA